MNQIVVVLTLSVTAFCILILAIIDKKKALIVGIVVLLFNGLLGLTIFEYADNHQYRLFINLRFNTTKEHIAYGDNGPPLPLPPKTAFVYRYATNGCAYFTKESEEEILSYYKNLVNNVAFEKDTGPGQTNFTVVYKQTKYLVEVKDTKYQQGLYFNIESVQ